MESSRLVLFVEDEPELREIVTDYLIEEGFSVVAAETGVTALMHLSGDLRFDALITDVAMPLGVSGVDVARTARMLHPDINVIVVSGHPVDSLPALPPRTIFIQKPYRVSQLVACLLAP